MFSWNALLALTVPDWMVFLGVVFALITGGATAGSWIWKGLRCMAQGVRELLKPWTEHEAQTKALREHEAQIKALQEHDAQEDRCNHRESITPGGD